MLVDLSGYTITVTGEVPSLLAQVEELGGCVAVGKTYAELQRAVEQAVVIHLQAKPE